MSLMLTKKLKGLIGDGSYAYASSFGYEIWTTQVRSLDAYLYVSKVSKASHEFI